MNLRQVRKKIKSVSNVKKITRAMQLVSAVKMKKAQQVAVEGRPYRERLEQLFYRILPSIDVSLSPLLQPTEGKKDLILLISSNKGLCGSFNMNLFRMLLKTIDFKNTDFVTIGKKGAIFAGLMGSNNIADFSETPAIEDVTAILQLLVQNYLKGEYATVYLVFNKFISTLRNESVKEQLLPLTIEHKKEEQGKEQEEKEKEYIIEPNKNELFQQLLVTFLEERLRGAVQNSDASEHSARMLAMKNATDNATDVVYNLTLMRNKLRQQKITYELLDMITAKESVET